MRNSFLTVLLVLVLNLAWFLPLFLLRGKTNAAPGRFVWFSLLSVILVGSFVSLLLNNYGNKFLTNILGLKENTVPYLLTHNLLATGLVEECVKLLCGLLFIRLAKPTRMLDYILIMGAAGVGFSLPEDLIYSLSEDITTAIIRGLLPLHMVWQMWMGAFLYRADQAKAAGNLPRKRWSLCLCLLVPVLTHGLFDFLCLYFDQLSKVPSTSTVGNILIYGVLGVAFVCSVITEVRVAKLVKESRALPPIEENPLAEEL